MRTEYEDRRVEKLLSDFGGLTKIIGLDLQKKLKITLNRLEAAEDFNEFMALGLGKPHPLHGNLKGYYGVTLTGNIRLIVKPEDGDLSGGAFVVKGVCDYHGDKTEWIIP